ncbi:hypothetical protein BDR04DRAFT_1165247 [Suillus decipiens]|nr:hypothetical protein BDR04DRAFT_1165247 [Suillus decipiens]
MLIKVILHLFVVSVSACISLEFLCSFFVVGLRAFHPSPDDGGFVETSSGSAARELKRRYDQFLGVGKDVRSPYIITAFVNQHGKWMYRVRCGSCRIIATMTANLVAYLFKVFVMQLLPPLLQQKQGKRFIRRPYPLMSIALAPVPA